MERILDFYELHYSIIIFIKMKTPNSIIYLWTYSVYLIKDYELLKDSSFYILTFQVDDFNKFAYKQRIMWVIMMKSLRNMVLIRLPYPEVRL